MKKIVRDFCDEIPVRFNVGEFTKAWQQLERWLVRRDTISPICGWNMGISLMPTAAERER